MEKTERRVTIRNTEPLHEDPHDERNMMIRLARVVAGTFVGLALLGASFSTAAMAAPPTNSRPAAATIVHSAADSTRLLTPQSSWFGGPPTGCPLGAVCFYADESGDNLCGIWYGNATDLGGCKNIASTVYNNGRSCAGCEDVNLYWGSSHAGAWYCLPKGRYLLHMQLDHFDRGRGLPGYGDALNDNVASAKWTSC